MAVLTKITVVKAVRRAYGPEHADKVAPKLPEHIDLDDPADVAVLFKLGLTPDGLFNALGGEL
ncbi:hypothetical protein HH310_10845 [Actinoplanes sp. TBRC 11911]|uniref:hypothetical protein n=1 Tax=Actinoplanes sp. TBRC 11911 TaxID=2729386 RepID=UPI00145F490D|nr:hypothetical protein [Actinoplanes sp. TBRC 11911]NMO51686.1 hypothetical protein [Actinoplanes sp. TBRC 11911]